MKPKRPTETDLLALIQNGFNSQLPKDREAQASAPAPRPEAKTNDTQAVGPASIAPMVRITLAVPEDLRFRLKMVVMGHRRKTRFKMTQDEYCARAIGSQLDMDEGAANPWDQVNQLAAFLRDCIRAKVLTNDWASKADAMLNGIIEGGR